MVQGDYLIIGIAALITANLLIGFEAEIRWGFKSLIRSKQLGVILGELFALVIFAGMTIVVALLLRPNESLAYTRFFVDVFAMLISAVVIFLTVNVWDLYHERAVRQVRERAEYGDYVVRFPDTERPMADLWLSVVGR